MDSGRIRRIVIALTAAYAVALHALFLSFVPISAAALADSGSVLCAYGDNGDPAYPTQHQVPCIAICTAMGHGTAGTIPQAVVEFLAQGFVAAAITSLVEWVAPNIAPTGPQTPRGPPSV
jgi:hypothetical protein